MFVANSRFKTGRYDVHHAPHVRQMTYLLQALRPLVRHRQTVASEGVARVALGLRALQLALLPLGNVVPRLKGYELLLQHPEQIQLVERPFHPEKLQQHAHAEVDGVAEHQAVVARARLRVAVENDQEDQHHLLVDHVVCQRREVANNPPENAVFAHGLVELVVELKKDDQHVYLLVAHNGISRIIESYFHDMTNDDFSAFGIKNCELKKYEY